MSVRHITLKTMWLIVTLLGGLMFISDGKPLGRLQPDGPVEMQDGPVGKPGLPDKAPDFKEIQIPDHIIRQLAGGSVRMPGIMGIGQVTKNIPILDKDKSMLEKAMGIMGQKTWVPGKAIGIPDKGSGVQDEKLCGLKDIYATCILRPSPKLRSDISGIIYLRQDANEKTCTYDFLNIQVNIDNVPRSNYSGQHGFHIHEYGDMRDGCESMGSHYNPKHMPHGSRWHKKRHIGDLGNVGNKYSMRTGRIRTRIVDYMAELTGPEAIVGRGIVLHEKPDDLGMGNNAESKITGNAGRRLACCVISHGAAHGLDHYTLYR